MKRGKAGRLGIGRARQLLLPVALGLALAACSSSGPQVADGNWRHHIGHPTYRVGPPYQIKGVWYYPRVDYDYEETGVASWYGEAFDQKSTANGEIFDLNELTAAHRTLPLPSVVQVTNLENGRLLDLRVNDRGPFAGGRILDVSRRAAQLLGFEIGGTAPVHVKILREPSIQVAEAAMHGGGAAVRVAGARVAEPAAERRLTRPASPVAAATLVDRPAIPPPTPRRVEVAALPQPAPPSPIAEAAAARRAPEWPALIAEARAETPQAPPPLASPPPAVRFARAAAKGRIFVQAGAFSLPENAQKLRLRIAALGSVRVTPASVKGIALYRVQLGPLATVAEAALLRTRLVDRGYSDARIVSEWEKAPQAKGEDQMAEPWAALRVRGRFHPIAAALVAAALVTLPAAAARKGREAVVPKAPPSAAAPSASPFGVDIDTQAKHAILIDADTGAVLLDKFGEQRLPPASMSKMMTAYVVFGLLKEGRIKLDDELPVSERAWRTGGSKMFVPIGGRIKIEDLLRGMIVQSGNDACLVLAEGIAGSEAAFLEVMNQKAKVIGLKDSHFADVDGQPNPEHWMTARDLATLALRTITDFPEYYHYYSERDFKFNNISQGNRNPLLYKNLGVDGLKTGHTDEAGYSLTASAVRDNRRIILVIGGLPTMRARGQEGERLLDWAFREFNDYRLFTAGAPVDDAEVWLGSEPKVAMTVDKDLVVTLPRKLRKDMKVTIAYDRPVPAPIKKGDRIGTVTVTEPTMAPNLAPVEAPLLAAAPVDRMGPFSRLATVAGYLIWGDRH